MYDGGPQGFMEMVGFCRGLEGGASEWSGDAAYQGRAWQDAYRS